MKFQYFVLYRFDSIIGDYDCIGLNLLENRELFMCIILFVLMDWLYLKIQY